MLNQQKNIVWTNTILEEEEESLFNHLILTLFASKWYMMSDNVSFLLIEEVIIIPFTA